MSSSRPLRRVKARADLSSHSQASQGVESPPTARPGGTIHSPSNQSQPPAGTGRLHGLLPSAQVASSQANANRILPGLQPQSNCSPALIVSCESATDNEQPLHFHESTLKVHGVVQIPDTIPKSRNPLSRSHISEKLACRNKLKKPQAYPNHKSFWRRSCGIFKACRALGRLVLCNSHHSTNAQRNSCSLRGNSRGVPTSNLLTRTKSIFAKKPVGTLHHVKNYRFGRSPRRRHIPVSNETVPLILSTSWTSDEQSLTLPPRWGAGWLGDLVDGWRIPALDVQLARFRCEVEELRGHIGQLETDKAALIEHNTRRDADMSRLLLIIKAHKKQLEKDSIIVTGYPDMVKDFKAQLRVFDEHSPRRSSLGSVSSPYQLPLLAFFEADTTVPRMSEELFFSSTPALQTEASHRIPRVPVGRVHTHLPASRLAARQNSSTARAEVSQQTLVQADEHSLSLMIDTILPSADFESTSPIESTPSLITDSSNNEESSPVGEIDHILPMRDENGWLTFSLEGKRIEDCAPVYRTRIVSPFKEVGEHEPIAGELSRLNNWEWSSVPVLELDMLVG